MQITRNYNSPEFNGAFLINYNKTLPEVREGFERAIGKHKRQIFDSFGGNKYCVMYVMKDSKDYDAANFILKNEVKFRYYPALNTKMQFEPDKPEDVQLYINKMHPRIIKDSGSLAFFVENFRLKCRQVVDSHLSSFDKILKTLKIDRNSGKKVKTPNGVTSFVDKTSNKKFIFSPQTALGTRFVQVNPNNGYDEIERYAFDENGNRLTVFNTPDGIKIFNCEFRKAINHHLNIEK